MLDNLKDSLQAAIKKIVNSSTVDEELIKELVKDVERALLQSDVDVHLVLEISKKLKERSLNEKIPPGLSKQNHIINILHSELSNLLGIKTTDNQKDPLPLKPDKTNKILMLGIQGSGKTTMTAKLAKFLTGQGRTVRVIGADTHRPGALVQLRTMCEKANVEVYGQKDSKDPLKIIKDGLQQFEGSAPDVILIDTAGRHKQEKELLDEMNHIAKAVSPDLTILVIDGTIGQQCFNQAKAFHDAVPVGGIIITKLDSSANGGGALAASNATGARVMYIGTGEKIDDLEIFSSTRFVGRLLGMGDIQAILDFAKRLESESNDVRLKRITSGKMNIDDFYYQLEEMSRGGSMRSIIDNIPGISGMVKDSQLDQMEDKIVKWRHIIQSMTGEEKADPDMVNQSRTKRIAHGSGRSEHDVKDLIKNYKQSKNMMKASKGRGMKDTLRRMGLG
jgi:signal recognition particle subunit SRP54